EAPEAADLLRLLACLAPEDVPLGMLRDGAAELPPELRAAVLEPAVLERTALELRRAALAEQHGSAVRVHRSVQEAVRDSLGDAERAHWLGAALRLLEASVPEDVGGPADWGHWNTVLGHALATLDLAGAEPPEPEAAAYLLGRLGTYLQARAE